MRALRLLAAFALLAPLSISRPGLAQDAAPMAHGLRGAAGDLPVESADGEGTRTWYGGANLTFIVLGDLVGIAGIMKGSEPVAIAGFSTHVLGSAGVHAYHDRWGAAAGSFLLHAAVPPLFTLGGGALGMAVSSGCDGQFCALAPTIVGGLVGATAGLATAISIDVGVLAWEREEPRPGAATRSARPRTVVWASPVPLGPGGAGVSVGGLF